MVSSCEDPPKSQLVNDFILRKSTEKLTPNPMSTDTGWRKPNHPYQPCTLAEQPSSPVYCSLWCAPTRDGADRSTHINSAHWQNHQAPQCIAPCCAPISAYHMVRASFNPTQTRAQLPGPPSSLVTPSPSPLAPIVSHMAQNLPQAFENTSAPTLSQTQRPRTRVGAGRGVCQPVFSPPSNAHTRAHNPSLRSSHTRLKTPQKHTKTRWHPPCRKPNVYRRGLAQGRASCQPVFVTAQPGFPPPKEEIAFAIPLVVGAMVTKVASRGEHIFRKPRGSTATPQSTPAEKQHPTS